MVERNHLTLLTDLYEITMAAAYYQHEMFAPATFSIFIREYPRTGVIFSAPDWTRS